MHTSTAEIETDGTWRRPRLLPLTKGQSSAIHTKPAASEFSDYNIDAKTTYFYGPPGS